MRVESNTEATRPQPAEDGRFFAYVSLGEEKRIAVFRFDPGAGGLEPAGSVDLPGTPGSLATDPACRLLYASIRSLKSVGSFRIDPANGMLTSLGNVPVADNAVYIVVDHTGRNLLTASYGGNKVSVHPIGPDGTVLDRTTGVYDTGRNPHAILMDHANRFVYVPNTGADKILLYRLDPDRGTLAPLDPPEVVTGGRTGPRHLVFHPTQDRVYFVNEAGSSVTAFDRDPQTGRLSALETLSTLPDGYGGSNTCADIEITPDGRFLYASNRGHDSLAMYAIHPQSGRLTALGQQSTEKTPRSFNIDPTGKFLVAAGQDSGKLATYRIDGRTGRLEPLAVIPVGRDPAWVRILRVAP